MAVPRPRGDDLSLVLGRCGVEATVSQPIVYMGCQPWTPARDATAGRQDPKTGLHARPKKKTTKRWKRECPHCKRGLSSDPAVRDGRPEYCESCSGHGLDHVISPPPPELPAPAIAEVSAPLAERMHGRRG